MADLRRRLVRLEQAIGLVVPEQTNCPACRGRHLIAFSDEPENVGPKLPYGGPGGACRLCRMPPPGTRIIELPARVTEHFAAIPWPEAPRPRFIEKVMLLKTIAKQDTQAVQRILDRLTRTTARPSCTDDTR
jgi:hypothetical protein